MQPASPIDSSNDLAAQVEGRGRARMRELDMRDQPSSRGPTITSPSRPIGDDTDLVANLATKQKATWSGGFLLCS